MQAAVLDGLQLVSLTTRKSIKPVLILLEVLKEIVFKKMMHIVIAERDFKFRAIENKI